MIVALAFPQCSLVDRRVTNNILGRDEPHAMLKDKQKYKFFPREYKMLDSVILIEVFKTVKNLIYSYIIGILASGTLRDTERY